MHRFAAPAALALALTFAAPAAAETRALTGFQSVSAADDLRVEIISGQDFGVAVEGSDAARIRTRVANGTLRISDRRRPWINFGGHRRLDARVRVTMPSLEKVSAHLDANVTATLVGECGRLSAKASTSGEVEVQGIACDEVDAAAHMDGRVLLAALAGDCSRVSAEASTSGVVEIRGINCEQVDAAAHMDGRVLLAGECGELSARTSMSGVVAARDLRCRRVDASAHMDGEVSAYASESYNSEASMSGAISLDGEGQGEATSSMDGRITRARRQ